MLVRINAAASGIKEYLETGRKKGREFDRDLIDQRLPITGNIELLDAVIDTIETKQAGDARYLHITLGFAEQFTAAEECGPGQINAALIREVVDAYRETLMAAYHSSEYVFYAEAHIPKVTHELNALSGDYETRLPHVHIVIPYRNLETDKYMNPFGYLKDMTVPDAIQEQINNRFGLRSPKLARRDPAAPQHPLGRHASSFEGQSPKQIRAYLDALVAEHQVDSFEQLIEAASVIGVVTVRQGKDGEYLNIKPDWADKGINIKGLERATFAVGAAKLRAGPPSVDVDQVVDQWKAHGAHEARYLTSIRMKKAYAAMTAEQRAEFLASRRAETAARLAFHDRPIDQQIVDAAGEILAKAMARIETEGVPTPRPVGLSDRIQLLIKELKNGRPERTKRNPPPDFRPTAADLPRTREDSRGDGSPVARRDGQDAGEASGAVGGGRGADQDQPRHFTDAELKAGTDPNLVLRAAQAKYGIELPFYSIAAGRDGSPRIVHAGKQYNLGDFFTKHLGKPWTEARPVLVECHTRTLALKPKDLDGTPDAGTNSSGDRSSQDLLRLAGAAIARSQKLAQSPERVARYIGHRNLGAALEATLRELQSDRKEDKGALTLQETIDRAGAAIARAAVMAKDTAAIRSALEHRNLALAMSSALRRLSVDPPRERRSKTVIEAIADSARRATLAPDRLKTETNPAIVLTAAQRLYGIDLAEYTIGTGADRAPRILHKDKQYNLADFFTKHLNRPWAEAEGVLRDCYHATNSDALPPPDTNLWRQFGQWRRREFDEAGARRAADSEAFRARVMAAREKYKGRKEAAKPLPSRQRAAAMAQARAEQFIAQQVITAERAKASESARIPRRNAHYREFLMHLATQGDAVALAELRRMAPHEHDQDAKISGGRSQAVFPLPTYSVDAKGAVTYQSGAGPIVKDSVQGVTVLKAEASAYDAAIRVAIARYGRSLTLNGDPRFVANLLEAAKRTGLELTLRDAARPKASPVVLHSRHSQPSR